MKAIEDQTHVPELQDNVKLILDMVEIDIHKFDQNLRHRRKGEGVALERDCTKKITSRQHKGATR